MRLDSIPILSGDIERAERLDQSPPGLETEHCSRPVGNTGRILHQSMQRLRTDTGETSLIRLGNFN
jgi:hypothetical protein